MLLNKQFHRNSFNQKSEKRNDHDPQLKPQICSEMAKRNRDRGKVMHAQTIQYVWPGLADWLAYVAN